MCAVNTITTPLKAFVPSWMVAILEDLRPTPGRLSSALRIVLASIIAIVLLETLRMPFISIGMYFVFLVDRESPAISLRTAFVQFVVAIMAIFVELCVVIASDNDPVMRLLSVAVVTFVAGILIVATSQPALGSKFGIIYCTVIALWETHAPADRIVKNSLYLVGTFAISLGSAVVVEYILEDRNPAQRLQQQRRIRYTSLENLFRLYEQNASQSERFEAAKRVSRIAATGQAGMMALYNIIVEKDFDIGTLPIAIRPRIIMLAQLLDLAAAFGLQNPSEVDTDTQARCARIADECKRQIHSAPFKQGKNHIQSFQRGLTLLDRVEETLHSILTMPVREEVEGDRELVALSRKRVPFFIPGVITNRESVAFALKISLCATLCYILYHALDWPGISTAVVTVLVTGLSNTGAIKQRLSYRVLGSVIGGLFLAVGASVFLFPHMDSITSLAVVVGGIAFIAAWIAGGTRLNYVGLQLAFSFYVVAFEGFSAPTQLAPARDRFVGILIALAIIFLVFDQLWPIRTTTEMRRGLASLLRIGADLLTILNLSEGDNVTDKDLRRRADHLRERFGVTIADLRNANTLVPFEFGVDRELQIQTGDLVLRAAITSAALFWNQLVILHSAHNADYLFSPELQRLRRRLAARLSSIADAVSQMSAPSVEESELLLKADMVSKPRYVEYVRNTIDCFEELQSLTIKLARHD